MKSYQKPLLEVMNLTVDAAIATVIKSEPYVEDNDDDNLSV